MSVVKVIHSWTNSSRRQCRCSEKDDGIVKSNEEAKKDGAYWFGGFQKL